MSNEVSGVTPIYEQFMTFLMWTVYDFYYWKPFLIWVYLWCLKDLWILKREYDLYECLGLERAMILKGSFDSMGLSIIFKLYVKTRIVIGFWQHCILDEVLIQTWTCKNKSSQVKREK